MTTLFENKSPFILYIKILLHLGVNISDINCSMI